MNQLRPQFTTSGIAPLTICRTCEFSSPRKEVGLQRGQEFEVEEIKRLEMRGIGKRLDWIVAYCRSIAASIQPWYRGHYGESRDTARQRIRAADTVGLVGYKPVVLQRWCEGGRGRNKWVCLGVRTCTGDFQGCYLHLASLAMRGGWEDVRQIKSP